MRALLLLSLLLLGGGEGNAAILYRIACGSQGGTDAAGNVWQSDAMYAGGARWTSLNQPALSSQPIPYQAERYTAPASFPFSYTLPAAAGDYIVTLGFLEVRTDASIPPIAAGQRVFSVSIHGTVVQPALDIFAAAGSLTPYSLTFHVTTTGPIVIALASITGNAVLSSIQVDSVAVAPPPAFAPYLTGVESALPSACPQGLTFFVATDTDHLFWCAASGAWHRVGDFSAGPSIFHLNAVDQCHGSGAGVDAYGNPFTWDCSGFYRAMLVRNDGSYVSLVGENLDLSGAAYGVVTWVPAK